MSQVIPGGRPRASSDGDILDEGFCGSLIDSKSSSSGDGTNYTIPGRRKDKVKSRNIQTKTRKKSVGYDAILSENNGDVFDSDGGLSSQSIDSIAKLRKRARRLSFKSMRKAVSRAFVKDTSHITTNEPIATAGHGLKTKPSDQSVISYSGKIWTPELRRIGKGCSDVNGQGGANHKSTITMTMSSARPLIMEPDIEMTIPKWKNVPGTMGIYNHGNSCFINTILQCLSNTDSFTEYFVQEFFKNDLKQNRNYNKKSVFRSSHGEVTEQLAYLLKSLWCGNYHGDISKEFKAMVGKYNDQYRGDHQHDAQEFLLWLLDRLHEDLCTPSKKKSKPLKTLSNKSEEEMSSEALSANGDSFVLKLFQALHSSTLTCPSCGDRSSTFDPYLCVSLPLPQSCPRILYAIIVTLKPYPKEVKYAFTLNQFDCVKDLRDSIATETEIPGNQYILCQLKDDGFGATYSNEQPLSDIAENETIYAIETFSEEDGIGGDDPEFDSPKAQVLVVHLEASEGSSRSYRFGEPSLLKVNRDITWKDLQRNILYSMEEAVCPEIFPQKLSPLFLLQVCDGGYSSKTIPHDVEMPLYTQAAERALNTLSEDFGPNHIKLVAIWDTQTKIKIIQDDEERIKIHPSVRNVNTNPPTQVSLDECFKLYTQEEKLNGEDAWLCPHCKQQQQGTIKSLGLWSLPDVLILHLKRFKQTSLRRSKLNTLVDFPVDNLKLSTHLAKKAKSEINLKSDDYIYDLIGVSNHFGNMMGGHYTAFCRSPVDGKWREFNDTKVTVLEGPVATKEAYILFYQRRSLTKDINQKLFTGDHWVFTLPLSSTNRIQEPLTSGLSAADEASTLRTRRTRSRSSSPLSHRHVNGSSQPTSPVHSPTSSRQSRTLQRQQSSPGMAARRGKSAGAVTSSRISSSPAQGDDSEVASVKNTKDRKGKDNQGSAANKKPIVTVIKHTKEIQAGVSDGKERDNVSSIVDNKKSTSSQSNVSASGRALKELKASSYHDHELQSDAKYPQSSHLSSTVEKENRSANISYPIDFPHESAGALRVNLENIDGAVSGRGTSSSSSSISAADFARKKLAERRRDHSYESQNGHSSALGTTSSTGNSHLHRHQFQTQTSYDLARNNPISMGGEIRSVKDSSLEALKYRTKDPYDQVTSDMYHPDSLLRYRRDSFTCSTLQEEPENSLLYSDESGLTDSSLRPRLDKMIVKELAYKHFGEPDYHDDLERSLDYIPSYGGPPSMGSKYATISGSREYLPPSRTLKNTVSLIPRSSTDQNIRYGGLAAASWIAPPSPTPPHSLTEERSFGVHARSSNREFPSLSTYTHHPSQRSEDQSSLASSRLSSHYSTMSRFRGVWGVRSKPAKMSSNVPNPCLRESSV